MFGVRESNRIKGQNNNSLEEVQSNESYISKFGSLVQNYNEIKNTTACKMFQEKFRKILKCGKNHNLYEGETQVLVSYLSNGYRMDEIPYSQLDEIADLVDRHSQHYLAFVDPRKHGLLLRMKYSSLSGFKTNPKRLERMSKVVRAMIEKRFPEEKFIKFSEIISRCK